MDLQHVETQMLKYQTLLWTEISINLVAYFPIQIFKHIFKMFKKK